MLVNTNDVATRGHFNCMSMEIQAIDIYQDPSTAGLGLMGT